MIATLAGGWAGAGPSSGFSGWKTTSGAVISATPETAKAQAVGRPAAGSRGRCRRSWPAASRRAAGRARSRPAAATALQEAEGVGSCALVARRYGEERPRPALVMPRRPAWAMPANGAVAAAEACRIPGWRATPAATALRLAVGGDRPLPVERDAAHRPTRSSSAASGRRTAASRRAAPREARARRCAPRYGRAPARGRRPRGGSPPLRRSRSASARRRARPHGHSGRDVGVVGRGDQREAELGLQRVDQVEHARAGVGVEVAGRLVAQQQRRALGERAGDRHALRLAARQLAGKRVELGREPDEREQLLRLRAASWPWSTTPTRPAGAPRARRRRRSRRR